MKTKNVAKATRLKKLKTAIKNGNFVVIKGKKVNGRPFSRKVTVESIDKNKQDEDIVLVKDGKRSGFRSFKFDSIKTVNLVKPT